jgi:hypothetical protein
MNAAVVGALIGVGGTLVAALLTALYTVGGRSSLQRRRIKQEVDLLAGVEDHLSRRQLSRVIEGRLAVYLVGLLPSDPAFVQRRSVSLALWGIGFVGLEFGAAFALKVSPIHNTRGFVIAVLGLAAGLVGGVFLGRALATLTGDVRAHRRWARYEAARSQLKELESGSRSRSSEQNADV